MPATTPDASGNGYTGTLAGSPEPTLGASPWAGFTDALTFVSAYSNGVNCGPWDGGGVAAISGTGTPFTLEARVQLVGSDPAASVCGWFSGGDAPPQLWTNGLGASWVFFWTDLILGEQVLAGGVTDTAPHILAADYDGTTVRLYLDGTMVASAASTGQASYAPGDNFWIGSDDTGDDYINAVIDEVRWSSVARYASDGGYTPATSPFTTDADTVALYHLDTIADGDLTVAAIAAHGAGYAQPVAAETGDVQAVSAHGQGFAQPARVGYSYTPITPTVDGYGYTARTRTGRAVPTITPPLAPPPSTSPPTPGAPTTPPVNLAGFGIPRVSETYVTPTVINGIPYAGPATITGVTDTNPAVVTIAGGHGLLTGDQITIVGVGGSVGVNGTWTIIVTGETTFTVPVAAGGVYTSGGVATPRTRTPWRPATVVRETWAKQLQLIVSGNDVTFFRNTPVEIGTWSSQDPFGDASAMVTFPSVTSFDGLPIPPALGISTVVGIAGTYTDNGYWQVSATGVITNYGDAAFFGDQLGVLAAPITGLAAHPSQYGYVLCGADGGAFCYGFVPFKGSLPASHVTPAAPVSGVAITATGNGYWMCGEDGGVFTFGDATFHGAATGSVGWPTNKVVGIARSAGGDGYILVADNGGVFNYGDAAFHGSGVGSYVAPYSGITTVAGVDGYRLCNTLGQVFCYGSATYHGEVTIPLFQPANSIAATTTDGGYWMSAGDGGVFNYGDAAFLGSQPEGGLPVSGSVSWLRLGAAVTINWIDPDAVAHTLFEGAVADFDDASKPGLQVQIVGVLFQLDWYLAKPIVNLPFVGYDPNQGTPIFGWDIGAAIAQAINSVANPTPGTAIGVGPQPSARPSPFTGNACTPVTTGILTVQRGAWDKLLSSYISSILAQASAASGRSYTVGLARPRTPIIELVNTEGVNWTVWTGGHGIDTSGISLDQTTPANAIYGTGTSPTTFSTVGTTTVGQSAHWSNSKYPRIPPAAPTFPLGDGDSFAAGDGQTGFGPFSAWMRTCGYPLASNDTYLATNTRNNIVDQALIEQYQQMAGLQVTGLVDAGTWMSAWTAGVTAGAVSSVYYQPLWELAEIEPWAYNPSGDRVGPNRFYNPRIPRVERYEAMGQNVSKSQGILSATLEGGRVQNPVWQGTITLTADPAEGSRFQIAAGDNILLKAFHGRDILFHISQMQADFSPQQMSVTLTVSATATALMTLAAIIARDTQAHGVQRAGRPSLVSLNVSSSVITFDSESSAGQFPDTTLVAGGWTVIRVPFSEYGQIAETSLTVSPAHPFAVGVFSGPVTPSTLYSAFGGNSPLDSVPSGDNPWNFYAPALDALGLLYGAGGPNAPCGYWPSDPNGVQTLTGQYVDGSTWAYAPAPGFVPWLWVAFWCPYTTTVSGRFLVAPATTG